MKKLLSLVVMVSGMSTSWAQINSLPYAQGFDSDFVLGTPSEFITNWTGNEVAETTRINRNTTVYYSAPAAMSVIPTSSFNGQIDVSLNLTNYSGVGVSFYAKSIQNGTGTRPTKLEMLTSIDGGTTWSPATLIGEFANENQADFTQYNYALPTEANNLPNVIVRFLATTGTGGSGTRANLLIDDVNIATNAVPTSTLALSQSSFTFSQAGNNPSAAQAVTITGNNHSANTVVTVDAPFQIATSETGTFGTTLTLVPSNGALNQTIYVRMNAATANTYSGTLSATYNNELTVTATLNGELIVSEATDPTPFDLSTGNYTFTNWSATSAAGTYPANMMLWINNAPDNVESLPIDVYEKNWSCLYNLPSRSRFLGKDDLGLSFLNTSTNLYQTECDGGAATGDKLSGKPGAAVVAINTTNMENIQVEWTGRTITPNSRVYALRMQYRIGNGNGDANAGWNDFATPIEYLRNETAGHAQTFNVTLPSTANNQPMVEVRWTYYQHPTNTVSGARAELALDDITISGTTITAANDEFNVANQFTIYPNPANDIVNFSKEISLKLHDFSGKMVLEAENTNSIDVSTLSAGVYILKTSEGGTKKLIVK